MLPGTRGPRLRFPLLMAAAVDAAVGSFLVRCTPLMESAAQKHRQQGSARASSSSVPSEGSVQRMKEDKGEGGVAEPSKGHRLQAA